MTVHNCVNIAVDPRASLFCKGRFDFCGFLPPSNCWTVGKTVDQVDFGILWFVPVVAFLAKNYKVQVSSAETGEGTTIRYGIRLSDCEASLTVLFFLLRTCLSRTER